MFHVYGLSAPERKLVLDWLGERREAFGALRCPRTGGNSTRFGQRRARGGTALTGMKLIEDIYASRD